MYSLMLDTGASIVVLPSSKIEALGFAPAAVQIPALFFAAHGRRPICHFGQPGPQGLRGRQVVQPAIQHRS